MARVEGVEYTPEAVERAREELIPLRDAALDQEEFTWATLLTHILVYLADYKETLRCTRKDEDD